jgi:hypothetical protein
METISSFETSGFSELHGVTYNPEDRTSLHLYRGAKQLRATMFKGFKLVFCMFIFGAYCACAHDIQGLASTFPCWQWLTVINGQWDTEINLCDKLAGRLYQVDRRTDYPPDWINMRYPLWCGQLPWLMLVLMSCGTYPRHNVPEHNIPLARPGKYVWPR